MVNNISTKQSWIIIYIYIVREKLYYISKHYSNSWISNFASIWYWYNGCVDHMLHIGGYFCLHAKFKRRKAGAYIIGDPKNLEKTSQNRRDTFRRKTDWNIVVKLQALVILRIHVGGIVELITLLVSRSLINCLLNNFI